jgi:hypothetical protein
MREVAAALKNAQPIHELVVEYGSCCRSLVRGI